MLVRFTVGVALLLKLVARLLRILAYLLTYSLSLWSTCSLPVQCCRIVYSELVTLIILDRRMCLPILMNFDQTFVGVGLLF